MPLSPPFPVAPPSEPFSIPSKVYFRHSFGRAKGRVTIAITGAIIAGLVIAAVLTHDLRFLLVALMVLFIAVPMVMAMVYFGIILSPEAARTTLLHTVELCQDGSIKIEYIHDDGTGDDHYCPRIPVPSETINSEEIQSFTISERFFVYRLKSGRLLIVPKNVVNLPPEVYCHFREFD